MNAIQKIINNTTYQQILADSFGGVLYNIANRSKYDATELLNLWDQATPAEQESAGGILKGAINFLREVA